MNLNTPLSNFAGIGPGLVYKLSKLNLFTVEDLIHHYPARYDDFSNISNTLDAQVGQTVTLQGEIWSIKNIYTRSRKVLTQAVFNDGTSPIVLTWFNSSWLLKQIVTGDRLQISGKLTKYKNKLSIMAPVWEKIGPRLTASLHTGRLVSIYPETSGLNSKWFRTKISQILPQMESVLVDPMPETILGNMLKLPDALNKIHFPENYEDAQKAIERLSFDELFYVTLATQKTRLDWSKKTVTSPLKIDPKVLDRFIKKLPFKLTNSQIKVVDEVIEDLKKNKPMNRLIQGEVGSGKTVVTAVIIYLVHLNKLKTLLMAPTEILAFQHFSTISKLLKPFGIEVGIYTGSKKEIKDADVIVGTHALISEKLEAKDVGLVIIDEQQRFGVEQRTILRSRAKVPHFLTTTATPIPRTVALTLYGDLDLSVINEMPQGRLKVKTYVVPEKKRLDSYGFIGKKIKEGDQIYVVTPLIELSETSQSAKAAKDEYEKLKKIFPDVNIGLLHGKLKAKEKQGVTEDFRNKKIQVLVSTSVVEVGMDIPNATIMLIEGAEKFGLSQLHQLRGRVGRGLKQSYCLLFTQGDAAALSRLKNLETTSDGMKLAELDLKIRGAGVIFGTAQSGRTEFKLASFSDLAMVEKTRHAVLNLLSDNPALDKYPSLQAKLDHMASQVMPD